MGYVGKVEPKAFGQYSIFFKTTLLSYNLYATMNTLLSLENFYLPHNKKNVVSICNHSLFPS